MEAKLIKVDKNGTKYYVSTVCPACNGTGTIPHYWYNENGRCFCCGGSGTKVQKWKEYTPEYSAILHERWLRRLAKKAYEVNKKFLKENNFSEDGLTWCVVGDSYSIKDELKSAGAKYSAGLGWHFATDYHQDGVQTVMIRIDEVSDIDNVGYYYFKEARDIEKVIDLKSPKTEEQINSEYVGKEGDKISVEVVFVKHRNYERTSYSGYWETDIVNVYTFKDNNGNILVWKTTSYIDVEENKKYMLSGTIKRHTEYKGIKQTEVKRCKLQD